MTPPLWFVPPAAFAPLDLGADARHRVQQLVRRTPALTGPERVHLAAVVETAVELLRRGGTGWAAVRAGPRRTSELLTVAVRAVDCGGGAVLDALARHLPAGRPGRRAGVVELPLGRALEVVEEAAVRTGTAGDGHRVRHAHLVVPHPDRRHLVVVSLGTAAPDAAAAGDDPLHAVGRSLSVDPPAAGGSIAAVLDPPGPAR